jgi:hypothetical protein
MDAIIARFRRRFSAPAGRRYGIVDNVAAVTTAASVSVGTTAVQVLPANPQRQWAAVANLGTVTVYVGPSGVVAGPLGNANAGFPVAAGATLPLPVGGGAWFAISGTAAQDVRVIEVS